MDRKEYTFELEASPYSWYLYAQELHEAANIIIQESSNEINQFPKLSEGKSLNNVFFLNFGLSIENLLKGTLIAEDPKNIKDFKIADSISRGHNLLNLLRDIKSIEFSQKEKEVFKLLSGAIPNWGKYPIPKKAQNMDRKDTYSAEIHIQLEDIWSRLIKNLYSLIKNGDWISPNGIRTGFFRDSTMENDMNKEVQSLSSKIRDGLVFKGNVDLKRTIYFSD